MKQDRTKQRDYNGITGQRGKRTAEQRVNMTTITIIMSAPCYITIVQIIRLKDGESVRHIDG